MGFLIRLETETGEKIEELIDPQNILHRLFSDIGDKSSLLQEIDWYGDTTFNRLQMDKFLKEWQKLKSKVKKKEEKRLLEEIEKLAYKCKEEPHTYLKFYGD